MSRPQAISLSGRYDPADEQALTPRTPRSRAGREAESFAEIELDDDGQDESNDRRQMRQQQSQPLLASSHSSGFPRSRDRHGEEDEHNLNRHVVKAFNDWKRGLDVPTVLSRIPVVVGTMVAGFLLFLVIVSVRSPDTLRSYIQAESNGTSPAVEEEVALDTEGSDLVISYDDYTKFPLNATEFWEQCEDMRLDGKMFKEKYWEIPAEGIEDTIHQDEINPPLPGDSHTMPICKSTITYQLSGEVGLFSDLALMVQAAGLARERGRTFFIDDTYWDRGRWSDYFQDVTIRQPGPQPGCRPPPPEELVACPRHARHWVVSSETAQFHFGEPFMMTYEDPYAQGLNRMKPVFNHAADSIRDTIRPNADLSNLIRSARSEFRKKILSKIERPSSQHGDFNDTIPRYIGVHVRRGDKKATSWAYHNSYVPIEDFTKAVQDTWTRVIPAPSSPYDAQPQPAVYFASDDPSAENYFLDGMRVNAAFSLMDSENLELNALSSPEEYYQGDFDDLEKDARIRATKGMIVDFALLTGAWAKKGELIPEAVICTISSAVCKMAAPTLGWERAFGEVNKMGRMDKKTARWVEIDEKGAVMPVWKPFDIYLNL